jgi:hypothetical protein
MVGAVGPTGGASWRWSRPARRSRAVGRASLVIDTCSQRDAEVFLHWLWQDDAECAGDGICRRHPAPDDRDGPGPVGNRPERRPAVGSLGCRSFWCRSHCEYRRHGRAHVGLRHSCAGASTRSERMLSGSPIENAAPLPAWRIPPGSVASAPISKRSRWRWGPRTCHRRPPERDPHQGHGSPTAIATRGEMRPACDDADIESGHAGEMDRDTAVDGANAEHADACRGSSETASADAWGWQASSRDPLAARAVDMKGSSGRFVPNRSPCDERLAGEEPPHHQANGCHGHFLQRIT